VRIHRHRVVAGLAQVADEPGIEVLARQS
jgi:hypothetical protein